MTWLLLTYDKVSWVVYTLPLHMGGLTSDLPSIVGKQCTQPHTQATYAVAVCGCKIE